jgi:hypothetical protein
MELIGRLIAILLASILGPTGGILCIWGTYVALKVFDDYKDSSDSTYLTIGGLLLAVGSMLLVSAVWLVILSLKVRKGATDGRRGHARRSGTYNRKGGRGT